MARRRMLAVAGAVLVTSAGLGAVPALAAGGCSSNCSATTNVTFALAGSGLSISVPTNTDVNLGTATSNVLGTTASGALRSTTVTDSRGALLGSWTVTVTNTAFTGSGNAAGETLAANRASMYLDAVASLSDVVALATGGLVPTSAALSATAVQSGGTLVAGTTTGSGTLTYTPGISITIPAATVAGTYSGSVTQTVS